MILRYQYLYLCTTVVFEIANTDIGILKKKKGFVKGCFAYSIADYESGNQQQNGSCDTVLGSWEYRELKIQTVSNLCCSNNKKIVGGDQLPILLFHY